MKAFVTGGTGFIGSRVVKRLRDRGDDVVVLARRPEKATGLEADVVHGGLADTDAIRRGMEGCQAVFHIAADYRVGMPKAKRESMYDTNVRGTERVLDAAADAGVDRIVYVSTVNAFGNTKGQTVDETYRRNESDGFVSYYDETKYLAHKLAEERAAAGAPVVIVQPGLVYGPGDGAAAELPRDDLGGAQRDLPRARRQGAPGARLPAPRPGDRARRDDQGSLIRSTGGITPLLEKMSGRPVPGSTIPPSQEACPTA